MKIVFKIEGYDGYRRYLSNLTKKLPKTGRLIARINAEEIVRDSRQQLRAHLWRGDRLLREVFWEKSGENARVRVTDEAMFFQLGVKPHWVSPHKHPELSKWMEEKLGVQDIFQPRSIKLPSPGSDMAYPGMRFLEKAVRNTTRTTEQRTSEKLDKELR